MFEQIYDKKINKTIFGKVLHVNELLYKIFGKIRKKIFIGFNKKIHKKAFQQRKF